MNSTLPSPVPTRSNIPVDSLMKSRRAAIAASRFFTALCLSLWIGGMAFFGIMAAPVLFHPEKSGIVRPINTAIIAPQIVGAMLSRFGFLTSICAVSMLIFWIVDGIATRDTKTRLWRLGAVSLLVCLLLSQYLNAVLLPRTKAQQRQILPLIARAERGEALSPAEKQQRAAFDAGHKTYQQLATLNLYLLMAVLLILIARGTTPAPSPFADGSENGKLGRE